jgi:hypothetical protein
MVVGVVFSFVTQAFGGVLVVSAAEVHSSVAYGGERREVEIKPRTLFDASRLPS